MTDAEIVSDIFVTIITGWAVAVGVMMIVDFFLDVAGK